MSDETTSVASQPPVVAVELPVGSVYVERYTYKKRRGGDGVQWLAWIVTEDGERMVNVCNTRNEALRVFLSTGDCEAVAPKGSDSDSAAVAPEREDAA